MTTNLNIKRIAKKYDDSGADSAWELYRKIVLEYVASQGRYISCSKWWEDRRPPVKTFLTNSEVLFENEFARSLFENWIQTYHNSYDRHNNRYHGINNLSKKCGDKKAKALLTGKIIDHVNKCWFSKKYNENFDYLDSQFWARGEEISAPGNSIPRKIIAVIDCAIMGGPSHTPPSVWKPHIWSHDIGLRIGYDRILVDFIKKLEKDQL